MENRLISVKTERCKRHDAYLVTVETSVENDWHAEAIEGAIEGYVNSVGCTECTAQSIGMTLRQYLDIFIDRFLPLISQHIANTSIVSSRVAEIKPLSYG